MRMLLLGLVAALAGCGPPPCAFESECGCYARSNECVMKMDGCFCPDACGMDMYCICGGGKFLGCADR